MHVHIYLRQNVDGQNAGSGNVSFCVHFGIFIILVCCTKKNLATLSKTWLSLVGVKTVSQASASLRNYFTFSADVFAKYFSTRLYCTCICICICGSI
jgi:riboflavin transporter FmnP